MSFAQDAVVFGQFKVVGVEESRGRVRWQRIEPTGGGPFGLVRWLESAGAPTLEAWQGLSAPGVVPLRQFARETSGWLLRLDDVRGNSLRRELQSKGPLEPERVVALLGPLLGVLEALDRVGLAAGLLSDEIVVGPERRADPSAEPRLTLVAVLGLDDMSTLGLSRSVASLVFELFTGRQVHGGDERLRLERGDQVTPLPRLADAKPGLDPRWSALVDSAWHGAPLDELRRRVAELAAARAPGAPRSAPPPSPAQEAALRQAAVPRPSVAQGPRWNQNVAFAVAGVALVGLVALVLFLRSPSRFDKVARTVAAQLPSSGCLGRGRVRLVVDDQARVWAATGAPMDPGSPQLASCLEQAWVNESASPARGERALGLVELMAAEGRVEKLWARPVNLSWKPVEVHGKVNTSMVRDLISRELGVAARCLAILLPDGDRGDPLPVHFDVSPTGTLTKLTVGYSLVRDGTGIFRGNNPPILCLRDALSNASISGAGPGSVMSVIRFQPGAEVTLE